ncbi:MAG: hypothetical protein Q9227_008468, partial [Pyrenula ochraceoflavens]
MDHSDARSTIEHILTQLGEPIEDPDEDPQATHLDLDIGPRTFSITQSPGLLTSSRNTGTTGAVLWKITPHIARWLLSANNPLRSAGLFSPTSTTVVELGCGISGLLGLTLAPEVKQYILTDQPYISKLLHQNLSANTHTQQPTKSRPASHQKQRLKAAAATSAPIFKPLDWETDSPSHLLTSLSLPHSSPSLVIACDCIYNDHLIPSFISTCIDLATPTTTSQSVLPHQPPTIFLIAQQLRSQDILQAWLEAFMRHFTVWRVPGEGLSEELGEGKGFVVH